MRKLLTLLSLLTLTLQVNSQCSVIEVPLSQRTASSDLIVEGKVIAQNSFWNNEHTMIYTTSTIELYKVFKGSVNTGSIDLITEGGTVNFNRISVEPSLQLSVGDIGIFTCETPHHLKGTVNSSSGSPLYEPYASVQGFVKYDLDNGSASDLFSTYGDIENQLYNEVGHHYTIIAPFSVHNAMHNGNPTVQAPSISSFSPTTITAGTNTSLTINGSGFGTTQGSGTVGFKNADDGGATYINPLATQIVSWSNTQIVVKVPSNAGTGTIQVTQGTTTTSSSTLTVSYAELNVDFDPGSGTQAYQTDHVNDNGSGGYTWQMNTAFDAATTERASFMRAFDTWRCNTGINWTIGSTTSINDALSDGTNCICNDNTAPLSAGILGVCYSYWSGCASGPTIVWYVNELDIIFDDGSNISPLTWQYGPSLPSSSQYDFESVAAHELGHGHQLGHVISSGQIMHYALSNGASNRTPSATDLTAAGDVQSRSIVANVCGPGAMTNYTGCAALSATGSQTNVSCNGGSNGTATVTASGGTTPYSYNWTPGNPTGDGTASVTGLTAGTWTCTITDNASSTVTVTFNITAPSAITLTPNSHTNVSCFGGSNGAASVNAATGGAGGFTYNWTPGNPTGDGTTSVTGLTAGSWTCTATDANGCTQTCTFAITSPIAISLTANSQTNISCNGGSNGAASVNAASGGAGGFTYNWTPGNPTGDGTTSVTGLTAGTWTCTATDANGCTNSATFNITQPSALSVSASSQTNISCNGGSNGAASVSASGGAGGYSYNWTPGNPTGDGTASVTGLTVGSWTCTVTDANGCTNSATFNITQPSALSVSASSQTNISCNGGSNGAASVSASGGAGGYSYNWTPGNPTGDGTASVTGLTAGSWTCTVTDANSCTNSATFNITAPSAISLTANSQTNVSCNGGSNGAASVNAATGGAGGFTYNWTPGNPTGDGTTSVTGLTAGSWTCTATDANGCTQTQTFSITQPSAISVTMSETDETCTGNDGSATATVSGGAGSYTYAWSPSGGTAATASNLAAATYTCNVSDLNGCASSGTVVVALNCAGSSPAANFTSNITAVCAGGSVNFTDLSSNTPTSWSWTFNGGTPSTSASQNPTVTYNTPGTYNVSLIATNASGSGTMTITGYITVNALPVVGSSASPSSVCAGSPSSLTGTGASTYLWNPGALSGNPVVVTPASTTTYTVTGTDVNGCSSTSNVTVSVGSCATATVPCGHTYNNKALSVSASAVPGATAYRFSFYDATTNALITQFTQASRTLLLANVGGIYYGTTYKWTVAVNTGSGFGSESDPNCTITLGVPSTTVHCGVTYTNLNSYTTATPIAGVLNYKFSFYDVSTNALVAQRIQSSNYIYFNQVPGLQYGTTYKWTIALEYALSTGGSTFGPESNLNCTITFGAPQTTVPCGHTYNLAAGYTTVPSVYQAVNYRYTFWQGSTQIAQYVSTTGVYIYFHNVSGLSSTGSYTWTVEVGYNNGSGLVYGPPSSSSCTISFSPLAITTDPGNTVQLAQDRLAEQDSTWSADQNSALINIYPNPTENGNVQCVLSGFGIENGNAIIELYDMLGNLIDAQQIGYYADEEFEFHPQNTLIKGMYIMKVTSNDHAQMVKMIVQ